MAIGERKSFTAKPAEEKKSFTAKNTKAAEGI